MTIHFYPDIVLIDGGNRPKIAEAIIPYVGEQTDIFVHDFSAARLKKKNYKDILKWYDLIAFGSPSLAKFRLKRQYARINMKKDASAICANHKN